MLLSVLKEKIEKSAAYCNFRSLVIDENDRNEQLEHVNFILNSFGDHEILGETDDYENIQGMEDYLNNLPSDDAAELFWHHLKYVINNNKRWTNCITRSASDLEKYED